MDGFETVMREAYSQTAWRPVKPLARAHLRKAVNKPPVRSMVISILLLTVFGRVSLPADIVAQGRQRNIARTPEKRSRSLIFWKFICDQNGTHSGLFIPSVNRPEKRHTIPWTAPNTSGLLAQLLVVHGKGRRGRLQASSLLSRAFMRMKPTSWGRKKFLRYRNGAKIPSAHHWSRAVRHIRLNRLGNNLAP